MSHNAGRPYKTSKNTDTSKNKHHHCWCYVFITQEKHISSAVRTELDLRGDVSGSTASSHATDHELLEIKVRTLLHCLPAGCPVFVPVKWVMPVCFSWGLSVGFFVAITLKLIYYSKINSRHFATPTTASQRAKWCPRERGQKFYTDHVLLHRPG